MPAGGPGFAIPGLVSKGPDNHNVGLFGCGRCNQRSWVPRENEISFGWGKKHFRIGGFVLSRSRVHGEGRPLLWRFHRRARRLSLVGDATGSKNPLPRRAVIPRMACTFCYYHNMSLWRCLKGWSDHDRKRECFGSVCIRAYADRYVFLANISFGTVNVQGTKTAVGVVRLSQYFACSAADMSLPWIAQPRSNPSPMMVHGPSSRCGKS